MPVTCTICGHYTSDREPIGRVLDPKAMVMCWRCQQKAAPKRGLAEILDDQIRRQYDPAFTSPLFPELAELHQAALDVIPEPHRKILRVLLQAKGAEVPRTQVAELAGFEAKGGTFNRYVSSLSSGGMVRYPKRTTLATALWLFPKTLGGGR